MAFHYVKKENFNHGDMVSKVVVDKAHEVVKSGVKHAKSGICATKKVIASQTDKIVEEMNNAADKMEEGIRVFKEKQQEKNSAEHNTLNTKSCMDLNSIRKLAEIKHGARFGWYGVNGNDWEELKLIEVTQEEMIKALTTDGKTVITMQPFTLVLYEDTEKFKAELEKSRKIASKGAIITAEEFLDYVNKYSKQQEEKDAKLKAIENGAKFGIGSCSLTYMYTMDRENGLIKAYEEKLKEIHYEYVNNLYVEGF